jgi:hypothetical protein
VACFPSSAPCVLVWTVEAPEWLLAKARRSICHVGGEAGILDRLKAQNEGSPLMSTMVATQPETTPKAGFAHPTGRVVQVWGSDRGSVASGPPTNFQATTSSLASAVRSLTSFRDPRKRRFTGR